jgi:hypothetical protein
MNDFNARILDPNTTEEEVRSLLQQYTEAIPVIGSYFSSGNLYPQGLSITTCINAINRLNAVTSEENNLAIKEVIEKFKSEGIFLKFLFINIYDVATKKEDPSLKEFIENHLCDYLIPFVGEDIVNAAISALRTDSVTDHISRFCHFTESVLALEKQEKGICKILFEKYGIINYQRYPPAVLLKQAHLTEKEITDNEVLVITAAADHSGTLKYPVLDTELFEKTVSACF